jgi:hypothetical protein
LPTRSRTRAGCGGARSSYRDLPLLAQLDAELNAVRADLQRSPA